MGRFRDAAAEDDNETAIDMSPLIDCVFILLIFFIVTTVFVEETGVEVDKPQQASASDLEKNSILIAITAEGDVIYNKQVVGVAGVSSWVKRLTQAEPDIPVIIQCDKNAKMDVFAQVHSAASLAGATTISMASVKGGV